MSFVHWRPALGPSYIEFFLDLGLGLWYFDKEAPCLIDDALFKDNGLTRFFFSLSTSKSV